MLGASASQHLLKAGAVPFHFQSSRPPSRPNQLIVGLLAESINSLLAGLQAIMINWSSTGLHWPGSAVCRLHVACHLPACSFRVWQMVFPPSTSCAAVPPLRYGKPGAKVWHFNSVKKQVSPLQTNTTFWHLYFCCEMPQDVIFCYCYWYIFQV